MSDLIGIIGGSLAAFSAFVASLVFAYKGWVDWKHDPDPIKSEKGRYYFWGGVFGFVVTIIVVIIVVVCWANSQESNDPPTYSTPPDSATNTNTPDNSTEIELTNYYVDNYPYSGASYSGYIDSKTKHPDGKGKMTYMNQNVYSGEWVDGVQQGSGLMRYNNGDTYDGNWYKGKKDGMGVYTWNDGKKYDGAYKEDMRSGDGIFTGWVDPEEGWIGTYYGESKDDKFDGFGKFIFDNGDRFDGVFKENRFWTGTFTRKDGSHYEIENGKPKE